MIKTAENASPSLKTNSYSTYIHESLTQVSTVCFTLLSVSHSVYTHDIEVCELLRSLTA